MSTITQTQRRRVLVIDDNPAIHEDFRKTLCLMVSRSRQ